MGAQLESELAEARAQIAALVTNAEGAGGGDAANAAAGHALAQIGKRADKAVAKAAAGAAAGAGAPPPSSAAGTSALACADAEERAGGRGGRHGDSEQS